MLPFETEINLTTGHMSTYERHMMRHASDMQGYYLAELGEANPMIYEYFEREVPAEAGQIVQNVTIIYPGTVGDEYYMTKGHYHANKSCSEVYLCLKGEGYLLMQTIAGDWSAKQFRQGVAVYAPPGWAHRSVNTGLEPLVLLALYPANAGHDYDAIQEQGFLKRVLRDKQGHPMFIDTKDKNNLEVKGE